MPFLLNVKLDPARVQFRVSLRAMVSSTEIEVMVLNLVRTRAMRNNPLVSDESRIEQG